MSTEHTETNGLRLPAHESEHERETALDRIEDALRGLRFGTVTAVVHEGVVVQVERTEKVRFRR
jgi:hypothetical protein